MACPIAEEGPQVCGLEDSTKQTADSVCQVGSRLAHLRGLPDT